MARKPSLSPEIVAFLAKRLDITESTVRTQISRLRAQFQHSTLNAVAQVYATQNGLSVRRQLSKEDKLTIPSVQIERPPVLKGKKVIRDTVSSILTLQTTDHFLKKHIEEINRAYSKRCFTCVFVLTRKVFENLIIDILRSKFPQKPELYFDKSRGRYHDFSVVMRNLFDNRSSFDNERKSAIERLQSKLKPFKAEANNKAHSLFHIVESATEVDEWNLNTIIALLTVIK